ncbi:MAG TPA: hypothetical protein VJT08_18470 [Terriglobales bacterium]|nr:hypothetical protein [Terriglobales bacterium]
MNLKRTWRKGLLITFCLAVGAACFWFALSPTHWLRRVDVGTVKVDGRPVDADIFFWSAVDEADPIALVHLKDGRDYFLDFSIEKWRQGNASEYVRLYAGAWSVRSLKEGLEPEPDQLPLRNLNEFHTQDGHEVSVQFQF